MAGVKVTIEADSKKAQQGLKTFDKKVKKTLDSIKKGFKERIGHKLFDGLSGAVSKIPGLLMDSINSASSLNEELGKSEAVFGKSSKAIAAWSQTTADALGLSEVEALQATGEMGNLMRTFGISGEEAAKMAERLVVLAADMGSFNEASIEDTLLAISSALRGESAPIAKFGADISAAQLKLHAFEKGIGDGKTALSGSSKVMAIYSKILQDTTLQHGNFKATSDDLANSQKRVSAKLKDASTEVGQNLLPAMQSLVDLLQEADFDAIAKDIGKIASAFVGVGSAVNKAYTGLKWFLEDLKGGKSRLIMPTIFDIGAGVIEQEEKKTKDVNIKDKVDEVGEEESQRLAGVSFWYQDAIDKIKEAADAQAEKNRLLEAEQTILKQNVENEGRLSDKRREMKEKETEEKENRLDDLQFKVGSMGSRSSNFAVSSMQSIGGGGGSYGDTDFARRQTAIQEEIKDLLIDMKGGSADGKISDF